MKKVIIVASIAVAGLVLVGIVWVWSMLPLPVHDCGFSDRAFSPDHRLEAVGASLFHDDHRGHVRRYYQFQVSERNSGKVVYSREQVVPEGGDFHWVNQYKQTIFWSPDSRSVAFRLPGMEWVATRASSDADEWSPSTDSNLVPAYGGLVEDTGPRR